MQCDKTIETHQVSLTNLLFFHSKSFPRFALSLCFTLRLAHLSVDGKEYLHCGVDHTSSVMC